MNYVNGDFVNYNNGMLKGVGQVVGISNTGSYLIGKTYILKECSNNIPNDAYNFEYFVCFECHMSLNNVLNKNHKERN